MDKFAVTWRKEGQLCCAVVEGDGFSAAWEAFKATKPGGGIPVGSRRAGGVDARIEHVLNGEGRCLATLVRISP